MVKAEEEGGRWVVVYMFWDFLCVMGMDKAVFIPLSYRTGRCEADNDGDAALKNWYLPFMGPFFH